MHSAELHAQLPKGDRRIALKQKLVARWNGFIQHQQRIFCCGHGPPRIEANGQTLSDSQNEDFVPAREAVTELVGKPALVTEVVVEVPKFRLGPGKHDHTQHGLKQTLVTGFTLFLIYSIHCTEGELFVQRRLRAPPEMPKIVAAKIQDELSPEMASFFFSLNQFAIGTIDKHGRPWATLVSSKRRVLQTPSFASLRLQTSLPLDDPFARSLSQQQHDNPSMMKPWAGVGINFEHRTRATAGGVVSGVTYGKIRKGASFRGIDALLETNENVLHCPKVRVGFVSLSAFSPEVLQYLTERKLAPFERESCTATNDFENPGKVLLTPYERALIIRCSTMYITTRHFTNDPSTTDVGLNHRGGMPGFMRVLDEDGCSSIVFPDYSGNRFYQNMGNIHSDKLAGLVIICFETGDILHVTGTAVNLFDQDAEAIMPRVSVLVKITLTGRVCIKSAINLQLLGPEIFSPYNPPIRHLRSELKEQGNRVPINASSTTATLTRITRLTRKISTFQFKLSSPVSFLPGSFAIFDMTTVIEHGFQKDNESHPQQLNDDLVRTFTISSATKFSADKNVFEETDTIECTVKLVEGGRVSTFLHELTLNACGSLKVGFKGIGCDFSCFAERFGGVPLKMLFIVGGIGIAPFLAMIDGLKTHPSTPDIHILMSARAEESLPINQFQGCKAIKSVSVFDSTQQVFESMFLKTVHVFKRRIAQRDVLGVPDVCEREVFLCGPNAFMTQVVEWLAEAGILNTLSNFPAGPS
ncbi:hypothetical protein HDU98_001020 [Podochytrium sp. JEL0797]|nr:hypothetical protein HDU98_001020 [Podochytrium sp. JEL0797]